MRDPSHEAQDDIAKAGGDGRRNKEENVCRWPRVSMRSIPLGTYQAGKRKTSSCPTRILQSSFSNTDPIAFI